MVAMELRALVSARSAADAFELRCEVREKLIEFLRTEHSTALPHARAETVPSQRLRESASRRSTASRWSGTLSNVSLVGWAKALNRRTAGELRFCAFAHPTEDRPADESKSAAI